jgi:hypothetical protein
VLQILFGIKKETKKAAHLLFVYVYAHPVGLYAIVSTFGVECITFKQNSSLLDVKKEIDNQNKIIVPQSRHIWTISIRLGKIYRIKIYTINSPTLD